MSKPTKIDLVDLIIPISDTEKANLEPMSAEEVQLLRSFFQREMDIMRDHLKSAREESAQDHKEVKEQLEGVRNDLSRLGRRVHDVEVNEESQDHADTARKEVKESIKKSIMLANGLIGTVIVICVYLIDRL
jgi:Asp-tRNA(Asn)/Glu-tRNA(Gln) amidotransferase A subunit family amidase